MDSIKIALVDSEEIFLEGLAEVLRKSLPTDVVLSVHSVNEIVDGSQNSEIPDVILIGEDTSFSDVIESVKKARELLPASNVATILHPEQNADPVEILKSGALGCLSKNVSIDDLVSSIRLISTGRIVVSPRFKDRFFKGISPDEQDASPKKDILSDREIEISLLVSQGKTNKEISELLIVTENTVKAHLRNILSKLHFKNRQQLVAYTVLKNSTAVDSHF